MATWRLTVHGDSTNDQAGKNAEAQIPAALENFVASLEAIAGTGVYLVQFEGSAEFQRLRGEDLTMIGDAPAEGVLPLSEGPGVSGDISPAPTG